MATIDSLIPRVTVHVYNAPANFIRQAMLETTREFCREAEFWREDLTAEDTVADQHTYALTLPADSEIVDFEDVYYSTKRSLKPKTGAQLNRINEQWRTQTGEPYYYMRVDNASVRLVYIPTEAETGAIQARAILQPAFTATTIDDKILNDYDEAIINGTLYRILRAPGKVWTDLQLATFHQQLYLSKLDEAKSRGTDERSKGIARTVKYGGL